MRNLTFPSNDARASKSAPVNASNNVNSTILIKKMNDLHDTHIEHQQNVKLWFVITVIVVIIVIIVTYGQKFFYGRK